MESRIVEYIGTGYLYSPSRVQTTSPHIRSIPQKIACGEYTTLCSINPGVLNAESAVTQYWRGLEARQHDPQYG